jgi:hypothetical protein
MASDCSRVVGTAQRVHARLVHGAFDDHALAGVLLDEEADLRVLQVGLAQALHDQRLGLLRGQSPDLEVADEGQRNHAAPVDAHVASELVDAEHLDLEQVLRADAVVLQAGDLAGLRGREARRGDGHDRRGRTEGELIGQAQRELFGPLGGCNRREGEARRRDENPEGDPAAPLGCAFAVCHETDFPLARVTRQCSIAHFRGFFYWS